MKRGWRLIGVICALSGLCACTQTPPSQAVVPGTTREHREAPHEQFGASASLEPAEMRRLLAGELVQRALRRQGSSGELLGGLAYQLVPARQAVVRAALFDVSRWTELLPNTFSVEPLDEPSPEGPLSAEQLPRRVRLTQGNQLVQVQYTVQLEARGMDAVSFWLDPASPHDIADTWGFFECRPFDKDRTLIVVGTSLEVGSDWITWLFGDRIEALVLTTPQRIVDHIAENRQQLQRAAVAFATDDESGRLDAALRAGAGR